MYLTFLRFNHLVGVLIFFIILMVLIESAPQNGAGYAYNRRYYGYYPYRRSGYSRKPQQQQQVQTQTQHIKRPNTGRAYNGYSGTSNGYSAQLLNDYYNAALKAQSERNNNNNLNNNEINNKRRRVSKADEENAKFAGANNQEADEESSRTALLLGNRRRCLPFGRDAAAGAAGSKSSTPKEQGRFLFDLNVYNVYPNGAGSSLGGGGYGCGGLGGGLLGGGGGGLLSGILSDSYAPPPTTPLQNFLTLFAPGILQNSLAATVRPRPQFSLQQSDPGDGGDIDPAVDPAFNQRPLPPIRRPNRVYFDSAGAAPITPAQLLGGVATTVNGIIQQLTGNVQPVYPAYG